LFIGGYLFVDNIDVLNITHYIFNSMIFADWILYWRSYIENLFSNPILEGSFYGFNIGLKSSIMIFVFIWARASFPRIRFDQLMAFCWTVLLPVIFALIILVPCTLFSYNIFSTNINLY
jgi:NADH-ubiquinone oxidoreductase chain 1